MKKTLVLILAAAMLLTACGSDDAGSTTQSGSDSGKKEYAFTVSGVSVEMNAEAAPIVEKLGGNPVYFESESCAFKGLDKQYDYGSYVIYTYPLNDVDYILSVELKDDTVETADGLCIGSSKDDIIKAMSYPDSQTNVAYMYNGAKSQLMFIMENDIVTSIQYTAVTE